jgi:RNA polymerase sigma-70 factor (ECF subfamily)
VTDAPTTPDPDEPVGRTGPPETDLSGNAPERVNRDRESGAPEDEDRLVEAARTDRGAFAVLYDRHVEALYHYVYRRVGDEAVAEDLTSATWERALVAIERYEVRGIPFAAWLYRIAGNLIANHHRRRRLLRFVPLLARHGRSEPHERIDERTAVRAALRELSDADQEVLALCYYAGLTPREIGEILGCNQAAVHKRLHRARVRLRAHLEGEGPG